MVRYKLYILLSVSNFIQIRPFFESNVNDDKEKKPQRRKNSTEIRN